jgi:uncharacterized protein YkwD
MMALSGPSVPAHVLRLPVVYGAGPVAAATDDTLLMAVELYGLIRADPEQRRALLAWDQRLANVAAARVADMQLRHWYGHIDPDGHGPNWWLLEAGIKLPADYERKATANNCESLTNNSDHAADAWAALRSSPPHRAHLLGEGWFGGQHRMGVACGKGYDHDNWYLWVVLTCD